MEFGGANDVKHQILDSLSFEGMKINLFTSNIAAVHHNKDSTHSDEDCLVELNRIGNGLRRQELWAIKRKINYFANCFLKSVSSLCG